MIKKVKPCNQYHFFTGLEEQLNHQHPLYLLANLIDWQTLESKLEIHYSKKGRPAKPIRLMCGLILLKHIRNVSDESIVEQFSENAYYQYFCGNLQFSTIPACAASELVHFRHRIGEEGIELILQESIRVNQNYDDSNDSGDSSAKNPNDVAYIDSTVQEKNIAFPTDTGLHINIIEKCQQMAQENNIEQRQTYTRKLKEYKRTSRFDRSKKNQSKVRKARRRIKTIAGRLVRELLRKLPENHQQRKDLELFMKVLNQKRADKNKVSTMPTQ